MIYDPVDFSEDKEKLRKTLGDLGKGENESSKDSRTINFFKFSKDIEEFLDAAAKGLTPLCPRPIQKNTLICVKVFERIKNENIVPEAIIKEFLDLVEQDLGRPAYNYLKKLVFKGDK